jgi:ATP-dependent RNA helicase DDX19/DBP5
MGKFTGITLASTAEQTTPGNRRRKVEEQVVVGTHGKLKDWINRRMLQTRNIRILVFDEADEMLKVTMNMDSCCPVEQSLSHLY